MELFVASVFQANYKQCEVIHVGKSGDLGVDVIFVDAGGEDWLIQVKRRQSPNRTEPFDTLQRLCGTLLIENKTRGIIVTTAKKFSKQLIHQNDRLAKRGYKIKLIDRGLINRMLDPVLPNRPWLSLLKEPIWWAIDSQMRGYFIDRTSHPSERLF